MARRKKDKGWVKLYRSVADNPLWVSEPFTRGQAWIDLIMLVNHETRRIVFSDGTDIVVNEGQHFTSFDHLAKRWHWGRTKVIRYLDYLANHHMILRTGTRRGTIITLINWGIYQHGRTPDETPGETPGETSGETPGETQTRTYNKNYHNKNAIQEKGGTRPDDLGGRTYE